MDSVQRIRQGEVWQATAASVIYASGVEGDFRSVYTSESGYGALSGIPGPAFVGIPKWSIDNQDVLAILFVSPNGLHANVRGEKKGQASLTVNCDNMSCTVDVHVEASFDDINITMVKLS